MAATNVESYLKALPEDRRAALEAVRRVILKNLDEVFEEGMQYGMIGYYVPHRVFPAGYHCDPKQPLPYAGLASQKGHMSLHAMALYMMPEHEKWFRQAWAAAGKKLDMGKACIRFKKLEDVPLEVVGELFRRTPAEAYIAQYEMLLGLQGGAGAKKKAVNAKDAKVSKKKAAGKKVVKKKAGAKK